MFLWNKNQLAPRFSFASLLWVFPRVGRSFLIRVQEPCGTDVISGSGIIIGMAWHLNYFGTPVRGTPSPLSLDKPC